MTPGDRLPDLTLPATGGHEIRLRDLAGTPLLLYFYPKDSTPGCTRQALDFAAARERFATAGVRVIGVSRDSVASHERFRAKQQLDFDLIADTDDTLCRRFDVIKEKSMYGRKVMGIERSTFLFDAAGMLVQSWRGLKVPGHVDTVLAAAEALA
jgi:peroxiredoxin Q/BCP